MTKISAWDAVVAKANAVNAQQARMYGRSTDLDFTDEFLIGLRTSSYIQISGGCNNRAPKWDESGTSRDESGAALREVRIGAADWIPPDRARASPDELPVIDIHSR